MSRPFSLPAPALAVVSMAWLLPISPAAAAPGGASEPIAARVARGEGFLTNLFDPGLNLLPEYAGSRVYWLFHDNYLAAKVLARRHPTLAARIGSALQQHGVTNSGKIEILFNEARTPLPFRRYVLTNVAVLGDRTLRTEVVVGAPLPGWEEYADLLLLAAIARADADPAGARRAFDDATRLWDGRGFADRVTRHNGLYATYKLALYLIAADRLKRRAEGRERVLQRLVAMQSASGGWITDYDRDGGPKGLANVETTCLAILALRSVQLEE